MAKKKNAEQALRNELTRMMALLGSDISDALIHVCDILSQMTDWTNTELDMTQLEYDVEVLGEGILGLGDTLDRVRELLHTARQPEKKPAKKKSK